MIYGVTYDTFWDLNPRKLKPFKVAYEKKQKIKAYERWEMGHLINLAVWNIKKYPKNPFGETEDKTDCKRVESAEIAAKQFDAWVKLFNEGFENRQKQESDSE